MRIRFDRGTLVIERTDNGASPSELPGAAWDEELAAWRVPAEQLSGIRDRISAGRAGHADELHVDNIHPPRISGPWTIPPLRWYQEEAITAWRGAGDRGVLALPTGSGKTIAAMAAIEQLGVATLVIVPTRILLDQWARTLAACWPHPIGRLGDGEHRITRVTVATYASAVTWAPRIGDKFGLVVIDEAHHVGAWCPAEVLEMLVAPARLGLTATPPAGPGALALERHVGPVVYGLSVAELVGDSLADYDLFTISVMLDPAERATYQSNRGQFAAAFAAFQRAAPRSSWRQFVHVSRRTMAGRAALAAWRASRTVLAYPQGKRDAVREILARHPGERVLVFTGDNPTAYAIARELLVMPVTCDIRRAERVTMIDKFRSGEAPVLVSSAVLDEGFDVPDAEIAIIVGGTSSERRHVQRIGRVLRPRPGKRAKIYELQVSATAEVEQVARRRRGLEPVTPEVANITMRAWS